MTSKHHLLALDQGTSSSRAIVFDVDGAVVAMAQREFTQHFPQPGWVEHDANEIWSSQLTVAKDALQRAKLHARDIAAVGITNQRETTVVWNRVTGEPIHRAIVWQDRRTAERCESLRAQGHAASVSERTGLVIDPYFSGTKLAWMLDHVAGARALAARGELAFGTIDAWLVWKLTGGRVHATDTTNASRTMLFDLRTGQWSPQLLRLLDVPPEVLPRIVPSSGVLGETDSSVLGASIPIAGLAGDQQSALVGQACFKAGLAKNTYGTGCFMLMHTGGVIERSTNGLISTGAATSISTSAATTPSIAPAYALEGSVFIGGAVVQWLRDGLKAFASSADVQAMAESVPDSGGVRFVPAFAGLGAPYWNADARGTITGLTRGSTMAHIARAALESIAHQSTALLSAMNKDVQANGGQGVHELRVDGGASANDLLMQMQADYSGVPVVRPAVVETTALGAGSLAGLGVGLYRSTEELAQRWRMAKRFEPRLSASDIKTHRDAWEHAVRQTTAS